MWLIHIPARAPVADAGVGHSRSGAIPHHHSELLPQCPRGHGGLRHHTSSDVRVCSPLDQGGWTLWSCQRGTDTYWWAQIPKSGSGTDSGDRFAAFSRASVNDICSLQVTSQTSRLRGRCYLKMHARWQKTMVRWLSWKPQPRRLKTWRQPSPSWLGSCWHEMAWTWRRSPSETRLSWSWATALTPSWAPGPQIRSVDADAWCWQWFEVFSRETGGVCVCVIFFECFDLYLYQIWCIRILCNICNTIYLYKECSLKNTYFTLLNLSCSLNTVSACILGVQLQIQLLQYCIAIIVSHKVTQLQKLFIILERMWKLL